MISQHKVGGENEKGLAAESRGKQLTAPRDKEGLGRGKLVAVSFFSFER